MYIATASQASVSRHVIAALARDGKSATKILFNPEVSNDPTPPKRKLPLDNIPEVPNEPQPLRPKQEQTLDTEPEVPNNSQCG